MVVVKKKQGEADDRLIARFKKKILYSGLLEELKERQRFKSPAEKRKEKKARIKYAIEMEKKRNS